MFKRFTPSARQVVLVAIEHARALGHPEMGPEHLLLGALRSGGVSEAALEQLGLREDSARARIGVMMPPSPGRARNDHDANGLDITLSAEGVWAIAAAVRLADDCDAERVGSGHVLLALAQSKAARSVLRDCAVAPDSVRSVVDEQQARFEDADVVRSAADARQAPIDDLARARADARTLLAIIVRRGRVARWLAEYGIDEPGVREKFGALGLGA